MTNEIFWIVAIVAFLILEASTATLVSIWFAGGSLAALIVALFGGSVAIQTFAFLLVSIVCIVILRKIGLKSIYGKQKKTNLDRIIGQKVTINKSSESKDCEGSVVINDIEWKVKSEDGDEILSGDVVTVTDIEGVKLIVKK